MANIFGIADYVIFVLTIVSSLGIGAFYMCSNKTTEEYLLGNRKLKIIPVGISLMISYLSAITVLGFPAEMYYYGAEYGFFLIGYLLAVIVAYFLFVPLIYPLKLVSIHEYVYMRYKSKFLVYATAAIQCLNLIFYSGVVLYGPATMLVHFTGIPAWVSMLATSVISIVYTSIGGFKAVIWSDVLQTVVVIGGLLTVVVMGSIKVGGLAEVFDIYTHEGRGNLRYQVDLTIRSSIWCYIFGTGLSFAAVFAFQQTSVQRYASQPTMAAAKKMLLVAIPTNFIITGLSLLAGIVAFSYYNQIGCDPFRGGIIQNPNQIIPQFIKDELLYPAVPGLFTACIFCGTVSSLSSNFNGIAAIVWQDVLKDMLEHLHLMESRKSTISKFITLVTGLISTAAGFFLAKMGGTLVQICNSVAGCLYVPFSAVVLLGALSPRTSTTSASLSATISFIFVLWIALGSMYHGSNTEPLPTKTTNCSMTTDLSLYQLELGSSTITEAGETTTEFGYTIPQSYLEEAADTSSVFIMYRISFMWFFPIGLIVSIFLGLIMTFIPGLQNTEHVEENLLLPPVRKLLKKASYYDYKLNGDGVFVPHSSQKQ